MEKNDVQIEVKKYNKILYSIRIKEYLSDKSINVILKKEEYEKLLEEMKKLL